VIPDREKGGRSGKGGREVDKNDCLKMWWQKKKNSKGGGGEKRGKHESTSRKGLCVAQQKGWGNARKERGLEWGVTRKTNTGFVVILRKGGISWV